jgi:hypothetical protein
MQIISSIISFKLPMDYPRLKFNQTATPDDIGAAEDAARESLSGLSKQQLLDLIASSIDVSSLSSAGGFIKSRVIYPSHEPPFLAVGKNILGPYNKTKIGERALRDGVKATKGSPSSLWVNTLRETLSSRELLELRNALGRPITLKDFNKIRSGFPVATKEWEHWRGSFILFDGSENPEGVDAFKFSIMRSIFYKMAGEEAITALRLAA